MSRNTVIAGMGEVAAGTGPSDRVRAPGAGPKPLIETQPGLLEALDELVHPETRGNADVVAAVDVEVDGEAGRRPGGQGLPDLGRHGGAVVEVPRLLAAGAVQAERRNPSSRPRRTVPLPQRPAASISAVGSRRSASTPRRRSWSATTPTAAASSSPPVSPNGSIPMTSSTPSWAEQSPTACTTSATTKAGYQSVTPPTPPSSPSTRSGRGGSRWVGSLPRRHPPVDHRRRRRLQRLPGPSLEGAPRPPRRRDRPHHHRVPLPTGHLEVEPHRAPHVQLHLDELAGSATALLPHDHRADRRQRTTDRTAHPRRPRPETTRPASRSATPPSPPTPSPPTTGTANGTTPSHQPLNQSSGEP